MGLFVCEPNVTQVLLHIVPGKQRSRRKICRDRSLPPNAVLHPALLNRKTCYLVQYLVSNTNMESVSSSKQEKKEKK